MVLFSTECCKQNLKLPLQALANHNYTDNPMNQSKLGANAYKQREARENVCKGARVGLTFDRMKK